MTKERDQVERTIRQKFGGQSQYAKEINYNKTNMPKKMLVFENKIKWINNFLNPLGLKVKLIQK